MTRKKIIVLVIGLIIVGLGLIVFWPARGLTKVEINGVNIDVRLAVTEQAREKGLSGQKSLGEHEGMLFVFQKPDRYLFWMKDMLFPLDIIYLRDGHIVEMAQDMPAPKAGEAPASYMPDNQADHVLEVTAGTARKLGWGQGTEVRYVR